MGKKILLLGAGGHAAVVTETICALKDGDNNPVYELINYLDDNSDKAIGKIQELEELGMNYDEVFCCIGNSKLRRGLIEKAMKIGMRIPTLIHPSAYISPSAMIKTGTIVEPKAIVNANSLIDEGCIISIGAIIDHDVVVEPYCHVNAGAICRAGSVIEENSRFDSAESIKRG